MNPIAKNRFVSRSLTSVILILGLISLASLPWTTIVMGTNPDDSDSTAAKKSLFVDPRILNRMIDDRRAQLDQRRMRLREAIDDLGSNHPSVGVMQEDLSEVEQQLAVWSSPIKKLVDIKDHDLRVMVVQLMIRVDQLESRNRDQQFQQQGGQSQVRGARPRSRPGPR